MIPESKLFDNEFYYNLYPDVKLAVENKCFTNGYDHFNQYGRNEGRKYKLNDEIETAIDEVNPNWSKHLTLKGYKEPEKQIIKLNIVDVPDTFKPVQNIEYPSGNKLPFERYFEQKFNELKPETFRVYLPIHWTAYYVNNEYGSHKSSIKYLQKFIDSLDKSLQYFTIIQYDDGILNDVSGIDLLVYSMGCKKAGYYPIPLISQPINNSPTEIHQKNILFSFFGANTHPVREKLVKTLGNEFVKLESIPINDYYDILKMTTFALCPRGYGITSFRMFEAMAFGCIPVYISDDFWEPFNLPFTEYGMKITSEQIDDIPYYFSTIDVPDMQKKGKYYYENFFVYSSCFESIIKTLT